MRALTRAVTSGSDSSRVAAAMTQSAASGVAGVADAVQLRAKFSSWAMHVIGRAGCPLPLTFHGEFTCC